MKINNKIKMQGITTDHMILTKEGWKTFEEIYITKDELYCYELKFYEDYDPLDNPYYREKYIHYIKPLRKNLERNHKDNLYRIQNEYIDLTMTKNYSMPLIYEDACCRYSNDIFLYDIGEIYRFLVKEDKREQRDEVNQLLFYSEKINNDNVDNDDITFYVNYIELNDIRRIIPENKDVFTFTMPNTPRVEGQKYTSMYRIYVKRNDKEFWV